MEGARGPDQNPRHIIRLRAAVARSYVRIISELDVRTLASTSGSVVLVASRAFPSGETLAALSELGMAAAYASAASQPLQHSFELRVGLIVVAPLWDGEVTATANASRCCGTGWLLDCELRAGGVLLAMAFGYTPEVTINRFRA